MARLWRVMTPSQWMGSLSPDSLLDAHGCTRRYPQQGRRNRGRDGWLRARIVRPIVLPPAGVSAAE
jgi:hypothetical protein